jgi:S-adenosyl-L-methionine hydrolase (adenosine-forming)
VAPVITFLSDYGTTDEFVGIVHGVIARLSPEARVIDVTHGIPRHAVEIGARVLVRALPFMPAGVHLAVVDPEVGARRRAVALRLTEEDRFLVGPDNGLLMPAAERFGGVQQAVEISSSAWRLEPVSATFHGRDLFAPVAARLAGGEPLGEAGEPLEPGDLTRLQLSRARPDSQGNLLAHAVDVDGFGNVTLDAIHDDLLALGLAIGQRVRLTVRDQVHEAVFARTFADAKPGDLLLYEDSSGALALAVNAGSAATVLGLRLGEPLTLSA